MEIKFRVKMLLVAGLMVSSIFATGCSESDSGGQAKPRPPLPPLKPLPGCETVSSLNVQWTADDDAFIYKFSIGYSETKDAKGFFESRELPDNATAVTDFPLEARGVWYHVQLVKVYVNRNQGPAMKMLSFYLPSCEEREEWQKAHREYEEPVRLNVVF